MALAPCALYVQDAVYKENCLLNNDPNFCTLIFQFPGGSDNYLTISGSSHPFLSSSEVGLYIFNLRGIEFSDSSLFMATMLSVGILSQSQSHNC